MQLKRQHNNQTNNSSSFINAFMNHVQPPLVDAAAMHACTPMPDSAQDDKIVDRCLDRPGAKAKQAREPPVGRATSLNSSAESKCALGTSPLAHAADEGEVHSRV
eukprot:jgi/Bigna1/61797/fgenesh1_kg.26_\